MNVHLTPELEKLIEDEVAAGHYASANEVVREGLRLLLKERRWREEVREKLAAGLAQAKAGQVVDAEALIARIEESIRSRRGKDA